MAPQIIRNDVQNLPGTLLGPSGEKGAFIWFFGSPNNPKMEPRGTSKMTKNHKKTKKGGPKKAPKIST